ncbi:MAG TPA: SRPBCC family protein [Candidatus Saccharimonadales bacterium]|jgi:uncharacterized protein YndB with AHSA1/START domain|nr:SRPBCC family protein [Candidatus Saccharimonadales bacterium]
MNNYVATVKIDINAPAANVWRALTDPELVKQVMFGSEVVTDWQEGSDIVYRGEWQGKPFEDKGKIIKIVPEKQLIITHYSPMSGAEDVPENYHTITYTLTETDGKTTVELSQDNNSDEAGKAESEKNWNMMLANLKRIAEEG